MLVKLDRHLRQISSLFTLISCIALVTLLFVFGWLVFGRYVLNVSPTWVEQLALLLICYITFLGAAVGVYKDTHLGVTFIRESSKPALRNVMRIITDLSMSVFGLVMFIACIELMRFGWDTKLPMLNVPESFRTFPAVICGGSMFIFAGMRAISKIQEYYFNKSNIKGI